MITRRILLTITAASLAAAGVMLARKPAPRDQPPIVTNVFRAEHARPKVGEPGDETVEAMNAAAEYAQARTAPGLVLPGAYSAAFTALSSLPVAAGTWAEETNRPYNSDDPRYRDPYFSVRKVLRDPPIAVQRFEEDKEFMQDLKSLLSKRVPVVFILLPGDEDFKAKKMFSNEQELRLVENLSSLLPTKIYSLLELTEAPGDSIDSLFLLPYDRHPNQRGTEWYAKGIVKVIRESGVLTQMHLPEKK